VEHFYVKFGDHSCIGFQISRRKKTDTQTYDGENSTPPTTAVGVGNKLNYNNSHFDHDQNQFSSIQF